MTPTEKEKENEELFNSWGKNLSQLSKKQKITEEDTQLLQCPFSVKLYHLGKNPTHPIFKFWEDESCITYNTTQYLVIDKASKKSYFENQWQLPIIHSFSEGKLSKIGEGNTLTILHDASGNKRFLSQMGNTIVSIGGRPVIVQEDEPKLSKLKKYGNIQHLVTPLGKNGIFAFHTKQQYCELKPFENTFQRFFLAPTPEAGIIRIAHSLRKLAEADPKTTTIGTETILELYQAKLKEFCDKIHKDIKTANDLSSENLKRFAKSFINQLPSVTLSRNISFKLSADLANGYTYQTSAISLKIGNDGLSAVENEDEIKKLWKTLTK